MKKILELLKLQIDNKTDMLKAASPKVMIMSLMRTIVILALVTVGLNVAFARIVLVGVLVKAELLAIVLLVTQLISLIFAIGNVINTLYLCRDNEMLVCLPVTPNQLFISKLLMIYINELFVNTMMALPLFITLGSFSLFTFGLSYYLSIPFMLIALPILPIVAAAFISIPLMRIIRFLKKHTVLSIIVVFSLVAVCLWGYMSVIGSVAGEFNIVTDPYGTGRKINAFIANLGSKIPMYFSIATAMQSFSKWYYFIFFILITGALAVATVFFTRHFFFKIAMSNLENTIKTKPNKKKFKKQGHLMTLLKKEILCVFRSSSDVFEYFLFTLLMPFIVFSYDKLFTTLVVDQAGEQMKAGAHLMAVAIIAMLSNISSASAVSRDGMNFYTSKMIPVNYYSQIFAKFFFNAMFTVAALIVTALVSLIFYPAWQIALGTLAVAMAAVGHIAYSIDTDIKNPTVNLQGDEKSSSVSKSTPKSLIYGVVIGAVLGLIVMIMSSGKNVVLPYIIINAVAFVFMIYRVYTLILRINLAYDKIEM